MKQYSVLKHCAALASALLLASAAPAQVVDFGAMVPEQVYEYPAFCDVKGSFTPTESGTVKFEYTSTPAGSLYTSTSYGDSSLVQGTHAFADGHQVMSYELEIGTTYYLFGMPMDAGSLVIHEGEVALRMTSVIPSPEEEFSVSENYRIEVTFNYPVTVGNVFLVAGDSRERVSTMVSNTTVTCDVANTVMDLYQRGVLNEGDEMTLRILQIKDAGNPDVQYGETGKLEIPFTVCAKPAQLVSIENADLNGSSVLDSYYFPGAEEAQVRLTFDRELSEEIAPVGLLSYGDIDNLDVGMYSERILGANQGKTASFDLSGRLRRPIDMLPLSTPETQPNALGISFSNIYSADGQRVYTGVMSNPTGFTVSFRINVLQYNVAADFTPPRGSVLTPGQQMEIWVMNGSKIKFDAVCFGFEENGEPKTVDVPFSEIQAVPDEFSPDDMIYTLTAPDFQADAERGIDVTLKNLLCSDGLDHSNDVFGDFKAQQSAVSDVEIEHSALYDVFDVTGNCVLKRANRAEVAALAKGLYIVNGKKMIIH